MVEPLRASGTAVAELAAFCSGLRWGSLPIGTRTRTVELFFDLVGVAIGGSRIPSSRASRQSAFQLGGPGRATIMGSPEPMRAAWAALVNGVAAHALELDDVTTESSLHPGAAVIPAALAVAEELCVGPTRLLEAIVAGYEVNVRVGNALNAASAYARGFHPTGLAGVFGAAAAASVVLGLDERQIGYALGIAGTMASGSLEYLSDGAWTKRLNPGWAAHGGVVAAHLAAADFVGPATALEGRLGFLNAYSDEPRVERLLAGLGDSFQLDQVCIKPYACCRYNHGLIDGMLRLRVRAGFEANRATHIKLGVLKAGALLVAEPIERKRNPRNVVDAQFSAPYAAAVALVRGAAGPEEYSEPTLWDPAIRRLMAITECYTSPELEAQYPRRWPAEVELTLDDGRSLVERVEFALGEPQNPVSRETLREKFAAITGPIIGVDASHKLAQQLLGIEAQADLSNLTGCLRAGRPS